MREVSAVKSVPSKEGKALYERLRVVSFVSPVLEKEVRRLLWRSRVVRLTIVEVSTEVSLLPLRERYVRPIIPVPMKVSSLPFENQKEVSPGLSAKLRFFRFGMYEEFV